ncbi:hypothetical protein ABB02_01586 [Clostridiaceae bacterium JG1575]|nr:hypothetical protein ABB02_01586 [Clostridiaceae bacterium JG1575]
MIILQLSSEAKFPRQVRLLGQLEPQEDSRFLEASALPLEWKIQEGGADPLAPQELILRLSLEIVHRRSLRKGMSLPLAELIDLCREDECVRAREKALSLLDLRMRTQKELRDRLLAAGFSEDATQEVLSRLLEQGLLDDQAYAKSFLTVRMRSKGSRAILEELHRKGVDKSIAADLLNEEVHAQMREVAQQECRKKRTSLKRRGEEEPKIREKTYRFLLSRGYEYDLVRSVYEQVLQEEVDAGDDCS